MDEARGGSLLDADTAIRRLIGRQAVETTKERSSLDAEPLKDVLLVDSGDKLIA